MSTGAYDREFGGIEEGFVVKIQPVDPPAKLPRTGQTICYSSNGTSTSCNSTGQGGDIKAGVAWPSPRFTDNSDGIVTDKLTGLMWTEDANTPGPAACNPGTSRTWEEAASYVACLNSRGYLGYTDWRLPNRKEIHSLTDFSQSTPALPTRHHFDNVRSNFSYLSSTSDAYNPSNVWILRMSDGRIYTSSKGNRHILWPVRFGVELCDSVEDNDGDGWIDEGCPRATNNTIPGSDVDVSLSADVWLTFDNVTREGTTTVTTSTTGPAVARGYRLVNGFATSTVLSVSLSIFAANIKSFSERPLMACVHKSNSTLL